MILRRPACAALLALGAILTAPSAGASAATLTGAGSSFVAPLEAEWAQSFENATGDDVSYAAARLRRRNRGRRVRERRLRRLR